MLAITHEIVPLPRWLLMDVELTATDIRLFAVLWTLQDEEHGSALGIDVIAEKVGITKFSVVRSLKKLVEKGFVRKELRGCRPARLTLNGVA